MKNLLLFSVLLFSIMGKAQTNLIKNGGFEKEMENWRGDIGKISPYDKKIGKNSFIINQFVGKEWKGVDQIASIPKNAYAITFSTWIKTDAIEGGKEAYNAGVMTVEFTNSGDKNISYENIAQIKGTTPWTLYTKTVIIPENAKKIRVMLALAQTSGTILYDDVKAIIKSEEDYLIDNPLVSTTKSSKVASEISNSKTFLNGGFEQGIANWNGNATVSTTEKKEGNSSIFINSNANSWVAIDQSVSIGEDIKFVEILGWLKAKDIKQGKEIWNNGMFIVEFTNNNNIKTTEDQIIGSITGSTDWILSQKTLPIPEGSRKMRIMLALSACTGTLYADNIQIKLKSK